MELHKAEKIARKYVDLLASFCERIEIAGSVRRKKPEVKDIEIVCIPKEELMDDREGDSFFTEKFSQRHPGFVQAVNKLEKVKGEPTGKYTQRILPEGINLDLFMANKDNWGYILAIRIGPDGYSKYLADTWVRQGYKGVDGMLTKNGVPIPVPEEKDLFWLLGLEYVEPEYRLNLRQS
ncbi:MAG: hypothetical protein RDU14_17315 [Melioribacteraceae bacterium]|nr:hypothetical protein [Melioribacteraceae bacterium]